MVVQSLITVNSSTWTAVPVPTTDHAGNTFLGAKSVIFDNNESGATDVYRRILDSVAASQKTIPAGMQAVWTHADAVGGGKSSEFSQYFRPGQTIAYLKSSSGSFDVAVEFIA